MTASVINATVNGINATGGNTAELELQVGGTTAITVNSAGYWVLANALPAASGGTGINSVGTAGNVLTSNGTAWVSQAGSGGNASYDTLTAATGYFDLPSGTTAQRPVSPAAGMIRYNTSNSEYEVYSGSAWIALTTQTAGIYSVEYLVIAGGGGGGSQGGGGGAGGYRSSVVGQSSGGGASAESALNVLSGTSYTVTIGAGGAGGAAGGANNGVSGNNSVFGSITSTGGGFGAGNSAAGSGGSGGGAYYASGGSAGSGTTGQGYAGGTSGNVAPNYGAGGGGGAGAVGQNGTSTVAGAGGNGVSSSINGSATTRAGGGGGSASYGGSGGAGGSGGGGAGGVGAANNAGTSGTSNTGSGGGGGNYNTAFAAGGAGGSGIVIIRYAGAQRGTGGTVTSAGGYTIHTFTSSGTYTA